MYEQKPLQLQAYEYLTAQIKSGKLEADVIYSETKTASELGISRTPLKDALVRLAQDRYVDIIPSKGFRLHQITVEDIENTYEVRCAVESFCAVDLFHKRTSPAGKRALRTLEDCLEKQQRVLEQGGTVERFFQFDERFHQTIIDFTNNPEFRRLHATFSYWISKLANATLRQTGRMECALSEHRRIYRSLLGADLSEVYRAVTEHLEITRDLSLRIQQTEPSQ